MAALDPVYEILPVIQPDCITKSWGGVKASFFVKRICGIKGFVGFSGIDSAKFRAVVEPGQRLYLLGQVIKFKRKKYTFSVQGLVDDTMVFEVTLSGMNV